MQRPSPYTYTPSRMTQPYRAYGPQMPGPALDAMRRGRSLYGQNPMDQQRRFQRQARHGSLWWHILGLSDGGPTIR